MNYPAPIVGNWYQGHDGQIFEVVAVDEDDHTVEIQHFDGTLEEFDDDGWVALVPEEADAPEDWTGPLDVEPEDHDEDETAELPTWLGTSRLDRDEANGFSEVPMT